LAPFHTDPRTPPRCADLSLLPAVAFPTVVCQAELLTVTLTASLASQSAVAPPDSRLDAVFDPSVLRHALAGAAGHVLGRVQQLFESGAIEGGRLFGTTGAIPVPGTGPVGVAVEAILTTFSEREAVTLVGIATVGAARLPAAVSFCVSVGQVGGARLTAPITFAPAAASQLQRLFSPDTLHFPTAFPFAVPLLPSPVPELNLLPTGPSKPPAGTSLFDAEADFAKALETINEGFTGVPVVHLSAQLAQIPALFRPAAAHASADAMTRLSASLLLHCRIIADFCRRHGTRFLVNFAPSRLGDATGTEGLTEDHLIDLLRASGVVPPSTSSCPGLDCLDLGALSALLPQT
jgi:hypothetical protein